MVAEDKERLQRLFSALPMRGFGGFPQFIMSLSLEVNFIILSLLRAKR